MYDPIKDLKENFIYFYNESKKLFERTARGKLKVEETEDAFHNWLLYKFGYPADADDKSTSIIKKITDEVLSFDNKEKFRAYLRRSMETWILDALRAKAKDPKHLPNQDEPSPDNEHKPNKSTKVPQSMQVPPEQQEEEVFKIAAKELFQSFNLEERLLISLYIVGGMKLEEISDLLGIPRSTIHYRLKRSFKKAEKELCKKFTLQDEKNEVMLELCPLLEEWWSENSINWAK